MKITVEGACDLHIHAAPNLGESVGDDVEIAQMCRDAGMRAIGLKCHFDTTMGRARYAQRMAEGIRVFGGVVLNAQAGGVNPVAVDAALRFGAKMIWMPTLHAKCQYELTGGAGQLHNGLETKTEPITILDESGALKSEVYQIIALIQKHDAILFTGHLSPKESLCLARAAREANYEKLVVTHPFFTPPACTLEQVKELYELGAFLEFSTNCLSPLPRPIDVHLYADTVERLGTERIIIGSDCGHPRKGFPHEAIRAFAYTLSMLGVSQKDLHAMMVANYDKLL